MGYPKTSCNRYVRVQQLPGWLALSAMNLSALWESYYTYQPKWSDQESPALKTLSHGEHPAAIARFDLARPEVTP